MGRWRLPVLVLEVWGLFSLIGCPEIGSPAAAPSPLQAGLSSQDGCRLANMSNQHLPGYSQTVLPSQYAGLLEFLGGLGADRSRSLQWGGTESRSTDLPFLISFKEFVGAETAEPKKTSGRPGAIGRLEVFLQSEPVRADASLNDLCFVDPQTGWAVGDRGTIWHTDDGGRHWHLQSSGLSARLWSVWFLDRQMGWAVGGQAYPYTGTSTGLVLATQDGGRTWQRITNQLLPTLRRIRMVDPQVGFAVGESGPIGHTGVWFTGDGGRSWEPMPGVRTGGWLGGDFFNPSTGVLVGRLGAVGLVRRAELGPARTPPLGRRTVCRVELVRPVHGWLVGEGGMLMRTDDAGASWQTPPRLPPLEVLRQFDLYALAVRGPNVWAAGYPGSRIFYSPDAGQSWEVFSTGQMLPIYGLYFADDKHGWAIGALGTILASQDGGRTWTRQRCGGVRAGLLAIVGQAQRVPWEAIAKWAGQEGYLTYVYVVGGPAPVGALEGFPPAAEACLPDRVHEAVVLLGGAGAQMAWRFPLGLALVDRQARHIAARWNELNDGHGLEALQAELVRLLRTWRPEVVLTHDADLEGKDPLGHLVNQTVLQAVELAEDPTAYVDQITQAGLAVWSVKRVFAFTPAGLQGDFQLSRSDLLLRLGGTAAEAADQARALLGQLDGRSARWGWDDGGGTGPAEGRAWQVGFRLLRSRLPQERASPKDLFERILLPPGGEARRMLPELDPEALADLQQQAQRRRHLEAIAQQAVPDARLGPSLLAQTRQWVRGLEPGSAGHFLYNLGHMFISQGQWPAAAEVLELLVELQPEHPAAGPALVWLVQYYASMEAFWRVHGAERRISGGLATPAWDQKQLEERRERAAALARLLEKYHPQLFLLPEVRFPLAVADRARGYPKQAERWLFAQRRSLSHDAWWACAQAEGWLDRPEGQPPKPLAFCIPAGAKPRLDGQLDEPFWRQAKAILLQPERSGASGPTAANRADRAGVLPLATGVALTAVQQPATGDRWTKGQYLTTGVRWPAAWRLATGVGLTEAQRLATGVSLTAAQQPATGDRWTKGQYLTTGVRWPAAWRLATGVGLTEAQRLATGVSLTAAQHPAKGVSLMAGPQTATGDVWPVAEGEAIGPDRTMPEGRLSGGPWPTVGDGLPGSDRDGSEPTGPDVRQPTQQSAEVRLAYDTQYLYIGIRCPKHPGLEYPASGGPRPRDPDLAEQDRVEIFLDLDRDWTTYWHLVVDHRGWPGEACWGDRSWNPPWFVAAQADAHYWTVEAAIGLDQLTGFFPKTNSVWTIGLERIVPGVGIYTFPDVGNRPLQPGEFGLLIFR